MDTFLFSIRPEEVEAEDEDDESDEVGSLSWGLLLFFYSSIQLQQYNMITMCFHVSREALMQSGALCVLMWVERRGSSIQLQQYNKIPVLKFCIPSDNDDTRASI